MRFLRYLGQDLIVSSFYALAYVLVPYLAYQHMSQVLR